jgi:hypothetical protein
LALDYGYKQADDGRGQMGFTLNARDKSGTTFELKVTSRWTATGEGLGEGTGTAGTMSVAIKECWDKTFKLTFRNSTFDNEGNFTGSCPDVPAL